MESFPGANCWGPMTLTFDQPEWKFLLALLLIKESNCAKLFWNPSTNIESMFWMNLDRWTDAC